MKFFTLPCLLFLMMIVPSWELKKERDKHDEQQEQQERDISKEQHQQLEKLRQRVANERQREPGSLEDKQLLIKSSVNVHRLVEEDEDLETKIHRLDSVLSIDEKSTGQPKTREEEEKLEAQSQTVIEQALKEGYKFVDLEKIDEGWGNVLPPVNAYAGLKDDDKIDRMLIPNVHYYRDGSRLRPLVTGAEKFGLTNNELNDAGKLLTTMVYAMDQLVKLYVAKTLKIMKDHEITTEMVQAMFTYFGQTMQKGYPQVFEHLDGTSSEN